SDTGHLVFEDPIDACRQQRVVLLVEGLLCRADACVTERCHVDIYQISAMSAWWTGCTSATNSGRRNEPQSNCDATFANLSQKQSCGRSLRRHHGRSGRTRSTHSTPGTTSSVSVACLVTHARDSMNGRSMSDEATNCGYRYQRGR